MKRTLILLGLTLAILPLWSAPAAQAQGGGPVLVTETRLPASTDVKLPQVDTLDATVFVAGNAERAVARLWSKADSAATFPNPIDIGEARSDPRYTSASVFVSSDGGVYYSWTSDVQRRVYIRIRRPGQAEFGPARIVTGAAPLPVESSVAANEDGVFVFWRESGKPLKYRRSADGDNWSVQTQDLFPDGFAEQYLTAAASSGRRLAVGYTKGIDDKLQPHVAVWNSTTQSFINERIPTPLDRGYANPSVSLKPDGGYFTAFRSDDPAVEGIYFAERGPVGGSGWTAPARIARGKGISTAADIDPAGNVHLFWITDASGALDLFYAYRRPGAQFQGPLQVKTGNQIIFNLDAAANLRDRSYGHAVSERFPGDVPFLQYFLFALPIVNATGLTIEGGTPITSKTEVTATLSGITGEPNGVRWRWGQPPLETDTFVPFNPASPSFNVGVPASVDVNCTPVTLYTQLRRDAATQLTPNNATIRIDRAVQAQFAVIGPQALDLAYTSSPTVTALIASVNDCSGIASATVSGTLVGDSLSLPVANQPIFSQQIQLTGDPGPKTLTFTAADRLGNTTSVSRTVVLDTTAPTLTGASPESETTLIPDPKGTTELQLNLINLASSDPGGVIAGITLQAILTPTVPEGQPVPTPIPGREIILPFSQLDRVVFNQDGTINVTETISLLAFFSAGNIVPGSYQFRLGVVDGAGNRSPREQDLIRTETLSTISYVTYVPMANR